MDSQARTARLKNPKDTLTVKLLQHVHGRVQIIGKSGATYGWKRTGDTFEMHRADFDPTRFAEVT